MTAAQQTHRTRLRRLTAVTLVTLLVGCLGILPVLAQEDAPTPAAEGAIPLVHTVQAGENLTIIAQTYGVTVEDLLQVNNLRDSDVILPGQELIIPGGQGEAVPTVYTAELGDSLADVAAGYNTTRADILATNRLINPYYVLAVGQRVGVTSRTGSDVRQAVTGMPHVVEQGESLLEVAARYGLAPLELAEANGLAPYAQLFPGQRLRIPGVAPYRFLPGEWMDLQLRPLPLSQGSTVSVYVKNALDGAPTGKFAGQPLRFVPYDSGFVALVGIDAFTPPGNYLLQLEGAGERSWTPFSQEVPIASSDYGTQLITVTEDLDSLLDMDLRRREDAYLSNYFANFIPEPRWSGPFQTPVSPTVVTAPYGDGRSYNSGPIEIFHTGVDFGGGIGTPILSPGGGEVVLVEDLELRGLSVLIDHGLGIVSGYYHLSEAQVAVGDIVTAGQTIGLGGSSGLSTGPHLHWELRVQDVPVDGMRWLQETFP